MTNERYTFILTTLLNCPNGPQTLLSAKIITAEEYEEFKKKLFYGEDDESDDSKSCPQAY